jgi:coenzyme F420-0:L-glutamate ligase/coenzyme F420-1:gamma-L-glutamate ligase
MRKGLEVIPVVGLPEVAEGTDLAELIGEFAELLDGDVISVTSKIVSKAEGRSMSGVDRTEAIDAELVRVVAQRGDTRIVQTRHGLVLAAAGTDTSNTAPGTVLLLPVDPDASARALRDGLRSRYGVNVGVVVTDTLGRPWRNGQMDLAIGAAGIDVIEDLRGTTDSHGNTLAVTLPAIADELAAASELVKGKADGIPVAIVRGADDVVLPAGEHGAGAAALVRDAESDMFSLGTREAAWAAATARRTPAGPRALDPAVASRLVEAALGPPYAGRDVAVTVSEAAFTVSGTDRLAVGAVVERLAVLLHAEGYGVALDGGRVSFGSR